MAEPHLRLSCDNRQESAEHKSYFVIPRDRGVALRERNKVAQYQTSIVFFWSGEVLDGASKVRIVLRTRCGRCFLSHSTHFIRIAYTRRSSTHQGDLATRAWGLIPQTLSLRTDSCSPRRRILNRGSCRAYTTFVALSVWALVNEYTCLPGRHV